MWLIFRGKKKSEYLIFKPDTFQSICSPVSNAASRHERCHLVVVLNVEVQVLPLDIQYRLDHACLTVLAGEVQTSVPCVEFNSDELRNWAIYLSDNGCN